ncbi:MAG: hypothetical protein B7733_14735 [Myxococcales bacterium FL481]|nr:MAG: hypothetical protein B7733_14735 [Myxococcales bacterium FL481]
MIAALAVVSGTAGLGHELLWTRRLLDVLGGSSEVVAQVFGAFFLGLSLGAAAASKLLPRSQGRAWHKLAVLESGVVALAIPAMTLPLWSEPLWPGLGPEALRSGVVGTGVKLAMCLVTVFPPALLMGATLPVMLFAARLRGGEQINETTVYAANTLGGVLGIGLVAGVLLPWLGTTASMQLVCAGNLFVAVAALIIGAQAERAGTARPGELPSDDAGGAGVRLGPGSRDGFAIGWLAFASGFGVLACEVVGLRMLMLVATISLYAPAVILGVVVLALGLAAGAVARWLRPSQSPFVAVGAAAAVASVGFVLAPLVFLSATTSGYDWVTATSSLEFAGKLAGLVALTLGLPLIAAGVVFPALLRVAQSHGAAASGARFARLLALNGLGALVGAEVAHRWWLAAYGPHTALGIVGLLYALLAVLCSFSSGGRARHRVVAVGCVAAVGGLTYGWLPGLPLVNPHAGFRVLSEESSRTGTLAVVEHDDFGRAMIVDNQYILGSTRARYDQERQAHLPLLLHADPRHVAFVGVATGVTPGAALAHRSVESIEAIEISRPVVRAAAAFFETYNRGVVDNERVDLVVEDGRIYLGSAQERFDVVVGDLFLPWAPGVTRLYSRESFAAVSQALRPGGLYCQWLPLYQLSAEQVLTVGRTMLTAFDEVAVFRNTFSSARPVIGLVGFKQGTLDWRVVKERVAQVAAGSEIADPTLRHIKSFALLYIGRTRAFAESDPADPDYNTLDNAWLEYDAGRMRVAGEGTSRFLYDKRGFEFQRDLIEAFAEEESVAGLARSAKIGMLLTAWELAARAGSSQQNDFRRQVQRVFPREVVQDELADWSQWPGIRPLADADPPTARQ